MSIIENVYYYSQSVDQSSPVWHRLEKYDYCDEKSSSAKRGFFARRFGKKRIK